MSPNPDPTLAETQAVLWRIITAPENVTEAPPFVVDDGRLSAVARVNIYANMYFFRILDALKEDFPLLLEKLGDVDFHNLITDYLAAHPPTHYSLRYAGQHLAEFMERCHSEAKPKNLRSAARTQDDIDLARFEWAQIEAFDAADARLFTEADLQKIPADQWPDLVLKLHPSVRPVDHDHRIVWRQGLDVVYRDADEVEWRLLLQIRSGYEFAVLCEGSTPETILNYLHTWISQGLLAKSQGIL